MMMEKNMEIVTTIPLPDQDTMLRSLYLIMKPQSYGRLVYDDDGC